MGWFLVPLFVVAVIHSVLYSGWRHMFFIYPAMLILTLHGIIFLYTSINQHFQSRVPRIVLSGSLIISLLGTLTAMAINHPYESMYFTIFAGKNLKSANFRYGLDFQGLCAKEALEYVLEYSEQGQISLFPSTAVVQSNAYLLPQKERARISWTDDFNQAAYFIGSYSGQREPFLVPDNFKKVYSVARGGVDLCVVYQNRDNH